jgi:hypothetical protein
MGAVKTAAVDMTWKLNFEKRKRKKGRKKKGENWTSA